MLSMAKPGGKYDMTGDSTEKIVVIKPGATETAALFGHADLIRRHGKTTIPAARLYMILNGLPKGERVVFDSLELRPLSLTPPGG